MKYTWRLISLGILILSGALFKINDYVTLGYIPVMEWVISAVFLFPVWWIGLQIDKARYFARELEIKDKELYSLFESVDAIIYSLDLRNKKLMISSKVIDLYGYSSEQFKANPGLWKEVVHPDDTDIIKGLNQKLKNGRDALVEYRIQLPNGEWKWIQKRIKPILDLNRKLIKVHGIDIDITERKQVEALKQHNQEQNRKKLEKLLGETEQRFKSLFVNNSDAIMTFSLEGILVEANQATEELIGYTFDEFKKMDWKLFILEEEQDRYEKHFKAALEGTSQQFTITKIHKDGGKRFVGVKMIPIITDNQLLGIYEICKDLTETKIAEEMLRRSDKLSIVGQLAAGVAHEIRNPLTTLRGFIQFFKTDLDERYVDIMLSELDRINLIVSEFLVLSKPQATPYEDGDLRQIIQDIISLIEPHASSKNIDFCLDFAGELPCILCEPNQLKQVFINLFKNAIEAMPTGGTITVKTGVDFGETISIFIIDQGIGIEEDKIPKLGEPFFSTKDDGTGLGLMVSFRIIENHGGTMVISSKPNQGTTIEISLPIQHPHKRNVPIEA